MKFKIPTNDEYRKFLKYECKCAVCGIQGTSLAPLAAHHEPPLGSGGNRNTTPLWERGVALCSDCHGKRTREELNQYQKARLVFMAVMHYPKKYSEFIARIV